VKKADSLKVELEETQARVQKLDEEKKNDTTLNTDLQNRMVKLEEELKKTNSENKERLHKLQEENDALRSRLGKAEEGVKAVKTVSEEQLVQLQKENDALQEKLDEVESREKAMRVNIEEMSDSFKKELAQARANAEVMDREKRVVVDASRNLKDQSEKSSVREDRPEESAEENLLPQDGRLDELLKENHALKRKLEQVEDPYQPSSSGSGEVDATRVGIQQEPPARPGKIGSEAPDSMEDPLRKLETDLKSAIASNDERMQRLTRENGALRGELDEIDAKLIEAVKLRGVIRRSNAPVSDADRSKKPVESVPVIVPAGKVVLVRGSGNFVIIQFPHGNIPAANSKVNVYREGVHVGTAKITSPINPPLASADVLTGTLQQGDEARQEP